MLQYAPATRPFASPVRPERADAVIAIDSNNIILFWSASAARLFGVCRDDALGRAAADFVDGDLRSASHLRTTAQRGDGTRFGVEADSEPWQVYGHDLCAVFLRDLSRHDDWLANWSDTFLSIELLLVEAESFAAVAEEVIGAIAHAVHAKVGTFWMLDEGERRLRASWFRSEVPLDSFRESTFELELPLGIGLPGRVCADSRAERLADVSNDERFVRGTDGITTAMAFPLALDGNVCGVLELAGDRTLAPLDDALEQMMTVVGRQISRVLDRDKAVAELRRSRQTYLEAEQMAHIGSFDRDLQKGTTRWSDELYRLFGYEPYSITPSIEFVVDAVVPEEREVFRERILEHVRAGTPMDLKCTITRPDGERRVLRARAMVLAKEGRAERMIGKTIDVTDEEAAARERRELEKQLAQASRMSSLGQLAATMAHEFNNVLMGIETFVKLLERRNDPQTKETAIGRIQQSLRRGRTVTDEILRFTRAAKPLRTAVDVRAWLRDFLPEALALTDGMTTLEIEGDGLFISGDVSQLNQVLANLVLNARDASPRGARIEITAARVADDRLDITVADRGSGIPDDIRARIFEPLFTTKRSGTGLGLPVVHQVVLAHDGEVRVESELNAGTRFHLLFPLLQNPNPEMRRALPKQVLIVEDDPAVAAGLGALLESEGVCVHVASSARAALGVLERSPMSAVIVDVGLPDMMGTELYDRIAEHKPHLPVIFITGSIERAQIEPHLVHPHAAFLRKPFESDQLMAALARVTIAS
ncbi:MAG: response regulator [Acidobacteria bacterium]|nr:response regulator [Acidobacteriota bacterium]